MYRSLAFAFTLFGVASMASAHDFGLAGLLSSGNTEDLPPLQISSEKPLADAPLELKSGTAYEIEIEADGSAELQLSGGEFFRAIWIDEIVINDMEVRPLGLHSLEFDDEGVVEISFVAIKPGTYELKTQTSSLQVTIK